MRPTLKVIFIFFVLNTFCFGQGPGTAAVPFILIGPSPGLGGGESAAAVLPTDDAFGFHYNPAQLGVFAKNNNFATQFYIDRLQWLPAFNFDDLYLKNYSFLAGYVLQDFFDETDLNIGIGYMRTYLNLGENIATDNDGREIARFNSSESCDAFSIGAGFKYWAYFSMGLTYKRINSNLAPEGIMVGTEITDGTADGSAYDFGLMITAPIVSPEDDYDIEGLKFFSNAYLGYAMLNMGDFIYYNDKAQGDPLPKTECFGLGLSFGMIGSVGSHELKFIEFELANQANDLMIKSSGDYSKSYISAFNGHTEIYDNIILGNSNDLVQVQNSFNINVLEAFSLGLHKKKGPGFPRYVHNTSLTISSAGILKLFINDYDNTLWKYFDIRYSQCSIDVNEESPLHGTEYQSISIHLKNLFQ